MTVEELRALIREGESLEVEFKGEEKGPLSDRDLVEVVVCLANRPGGEDGWPLIGVEDDGRVTGARTRHEAGVTDPNRVAALIAGRTRPGVAVTEGFPQGRWPASSRSPTRRLGWCWPDCRNPAWWRPGVRRELAPGISRLRPIAAWGRRPRMCGSEGLSRSNRSRWCSSTWLPTGG